MTSAWLHIIAMVSMLCDHLWGTIIPGNEWLTCIGRISFPIFAFLIVEGYFKTRNLKNYVYRLAMLAFISEVPFNLMMASTPFFPFHQNVIWSFLLSLGLIHWNESAKNSGNVWKRIAIGVFSVAIGYIIGLVTMVDFYHAGILTVLVFYFFNQKKWWSYVGQFICLWYINTELLGGLVYELEWFTFPQQGFALLALLPIWIYNGKKGHSSKLFQYSCYIFYPLHMLLLWIIKMW